MANDISKRSENNIIVAVVAVVVVSVLGFFLFANECECFLFLFSSSSSVLTVFSISAHTEHIHSIEWWCVECIEK